MEEEEEEEEESQRVGEREEEEESAAPNHNQQPTTSRMNTDQQNKPTDTHTKRTPPTMGTTKTTNHSYWNVPIVVVVSPSCVRVRVCSLCLFASVWLLAGGCYY